MGDGLKDEQLPEAAQEGVGGEGENRRGVTDAEVNRLNERRAEGFRCVVAYGVCDEAAQEGG